MQTVQQIITKALIDMGADGLAGEDCGCGIDDLFPCYCPLKCEPARMTTYSDKKWEGLGLTAICECEDGDEIFVPFDHPALKPLLVKKSTTYDGKKVDHAISEDETMASVYGYAFEFVEEGAGHSCCLVCQERTCTFPCTPRHRKDRKNGYWRRLGPDKG